MTILIITCLTCMAVFLAIGLFRIGKGLRSLSRVDVKSDSSISDED